MKFLKKHIKVRTIKYIILVFFLIALVGAEWYYSTLSNQLIGKHKITTDEINTLVFWRNTSKYLLEFGFLILFLYYLSLRKGKKGIITSLFSYFNNKKKNEN